MGKNKHGVASSAALVPAPSGRQDTHLVGSSGGSIHHLAVETLVEIFRLCVRPIHQETTPPPTCKIPNQSLGPRLGSARLQDDRCSPKEFYDWVKVTHVCKHWRNIALDAPDLWTNIQLTRRRDALSVADLFVQRSRNRRLSIVTYETKGEENDDLWSFLNAITVAISLRLQRLTLNFDEVLETELPMWRGLPPVCDRFIILDHVSAKAITRESTDISFGAVTHDGGLLPWPNSLETPLNPFGRWVSFGSFRSSITTFEMLSPRDLSTGEFNMRLDILSDLKELETLTLVNFQPHHFDPSVTYPVAAMPKLRWLKASFDDTTWRVPFLLDRLDVSLTRLTVEMGEHGYQKQLSHHAGQEAHMLMTTLGDKISAIFRSGNPFQTLRIHMAHDRDDPDRPEISVWGIPSKSLDGEPALALGTFSHHIAQPFLHGLLDRLSLQHVANLDLSCDFAPDGVFHAILPETWHVACCCMESIQTLTLSHSPPFHFLHAFGSSDHPILFPGLRVLHLKNVNFGFYEDLGVQSEPWSIKFFDMLSFRSHVGKRIQCLRVENAMNFTENTKLALKWGSGFSAGLVDELEWDEKERVVPSSDKIHVDDIR